MILFTKAHERKLYANGLASQKDSDFDPWPVVKLFTPDANCTWLVTASDPIEPNILSVLADLGLGYCEYGTILYSELTDIRGAIGLPVERDRWWEPQGPISAYIKASGGTLLGDHLAKTEGGAA